MCQSRLLTDESTFNEHQTAHDVPKIARHRRVSKSVAMKAHNELVMPISYILPAWPFAQTVMRDVTGLFEGFACLLYLMVKKAT